MKPLRSLYVGFLLSEKRFIFKGMKNYYKEQSKLQFLIQYFIEVAIAISEEKLLLGQGIEPRTSCKLYKRANHLTNLAKHKKQNKYIYIYI